MSGYAIVFDSMSLDLGGFKEIISPEAVDRTLSSGEEVFALFDHNSANVIANTRNGTLQLRKDVKGLAVTIDPADTQVGRDTLALVARGDVSGMSFGFRVLEDSWNYDAKVPVRTIHDMRVSEVSIVAMPAYKATNIQEALRSLDVFKQHNPTRDAKWAETRLRLAR